MGRGEDNWKAVANVYVQRPGPTAPGRIRRSHPNHSERFCDSSLEMRIGIRVQLGLLVLLAAIVPLAVLSIAVWFNNRNFVVSVTSRELALTASLKAAEIAADILLLQSTCATIVTRILLQQAIKGFYQGNLSTDNWAAAENDVSGALASGGISALLQVKIFSKNSTGNPYGLLNITANLTDADIFLPLYTYPDGTHYKLGDAGLGYPPPLYPNITYTSTNVTDPSDPTTNGSLASAFPDFPLNSSSVLFLGPLQVNSTYAMVSLTLPIIDNTDKTTVLAYMTIVAAATSLIDVTTSQEGLGDTGIVLLIGPNRRENHFRYADRPATVSYKPNITELDTASVKYVFPPHVVSGQSDRHSTYNLQIMSSSTNTTNFSMGSYPAAVDGFSRQSQAVNNASSILSTYNENGASVAVGYARPNSPLVDWLLIVEQAHSEAWGPIANLRHILLACAFGTIGVVLFLTIPVVHYSIAPIRRLRDATEKSIAPSGDTPNGSIRSERLDGLDDYSDDEIGDEENAGNISQASKKKSGFFVRMRRLGRNGRRKSSKRERTEEERRRAFRIPGKVRDRKHFIKDELTDLTTTFNEMTDELMGQYERLEEKVAQRTQELELSKKAAEAANESKTLFIANISHELKTPLNGILGMCAVCMGEEDLPKIKRSLQVVYKSGDLLLHLLNDLLTFSKNQIGQQLSLEEKEFRLSDVKTQLRTIFDKQIREGHINFSVKYVSADCIDKSPEIQLSEKELPAIGPHGLGRLKDMCLWGDQHRILQVIINLVSNSLKFTPEGGTVAVRIKCLGEDESPDSSRKSVGSKDSSRRESRTSRNRHRNGSGSNNSQTSKSGPSNGVPKQAGTALAINPMDPKATPHVQVRERSRTPPPPGAKTLIFEFEVEDTGPGIPEHLQQTVFEPFVQGDLGLSKKYGGTGLGLSICSQLATLMGGGIALDSTPGKGSRFTMKIPLKFVKERAPSTSSMGSDPQSRPGSRPLSASSVTPDRSTGAQIGGDSTANLTTAKPINFEKDKQPRLVGLSQPFFAAATAPSPPPGSDPKKQLAALEHVAAAKGPEAKLRVLVAEDNLVNQEVVLRMLKLEDIYDVVVAKDGQEAYDLVKQNMDKGQYFNLIFMDIQMPNLDGLQSTRLIRQMGYSAPIVALTAFSEESNVKECYASGMDMFLSKPIRRPALKQVLKKFATIPEETETNECGSLTRKSTPEKETSTLTSEAGPSQQSQPPLNIGAATTDEH